MKDYIKKLSIAASLLLFILQSCDSKRPTGYLAGSIMDSTYKPISNARIEVAGLKGLTDDEGKYFIKSLPHGRHKFQLYYATNIL
ncbi:MAG: hypothetical protein GWN01_02380, partial [Nitrosopumilaceae archaeon]|nr:carboxypeptidase regulatory-like domain-containing protein [Nitrosopumilaceae archaeon]NIU86172.1 hypothetical protein [Nitrosopumilaceae archaeon]NIX60419.1 hypothetical protein [Nitrosopumilaceae archaeon]